MKFQFLPENFSRSENAPPFETRKIRHFEVERIFLENKKMVDHLDFLIRQPLTADDFLFLHNVLAVRRLRVLRTTPLFRREKPFSAVSESFTPSLDAFSPFAE